jgi:hypothetical protein
MIMKWQMHYCRGGALAMMGTALMGMEIAHLRAGLMGLTQENGGSTEVPHHSLRHL